MFRVSVIDPGHVRRDLSFHEPGPAWECFIDAIKAALIEGGHVFLYEADKLRAYVIGGAGCLGRESENHRRGKPPAPPRGHYATEINHFNTPC
jgi:hypothetical protein